MGRKKEKQCPKMATWLTTFGDLMSLLLTFFILLLSFSVIEEIKFLEAVGSLQGALGVLQGNTNAPLPEIYFVDVDESSSESTSDYNENFEMMQQLQEELDIELQKQLEQMEEKTKGEGDADAENERESKFYLETSGQDYIEMEVSDFGVHITINDSVLFDSGKALLKDDFKFALNAIGKVVAKNIDKYNIVIEGHTDNTPINTAQFPSNWELSAYRAINVLKFMLDNFKIPPSSAYYTGYGEYKPIASNDTREGRAKNRRVEIFLRKNSPDNTKQDDLGFQ